MTVNFNGLASSYWEKQRQRISDFTNRLRQQQFTKEGCDIPDPDSSSQLAIGEGRRLAACVMFLDICGFSKRPMETAVEQDLMLKIVSLFFSEMIRIAEEYGGQIEKNTGDGLLVYFSDDSEISAAQKAVACALTMQSATTHLINPVVKESNSQEIHFRISMNYGYITVAKIGAANRFNSYAAIGATANFACKMLKYATEDQIVMGDSAKKKLPVDWQIKWTEILPVNTGWNYISNGAPYSIHLYNGRWSKLI